MAGDTVPQTVSEKTGNDVTANSFRNKHAVTHSGPSARRAFFLPLIVIRLTRNPTKNDLIPTLKALSVSGLLKPMSAFTIVTVEGGFFK